MDFILMYRRCQASGGTKGYVHRENSRMPGYYDGRYWTLWKLPMFGCNDSSQVLNEINECKKAYPNAYIRCLAFDNTRQAQCMSFVIQNPKATTH
ncbi:ribulose-bisphosphate carboxylase, putative [Ricinus communis]|uniref:Ribulose bisphosphate carboxylase small subunit n=1 Tax=Ricinus communis TaxID=3988 RepID=B9SYG1_RICCO|nr:ribulose-bisphosphate carboxylase, putative [Ricinus communis]